MDNVCGKCQFFERMKWHKSVDPKEEDQHGGKCVLLARTLTNSCLWNVEYLYVMDNFGCSMFKSN